MTVMAIELVAGLTNCGAHPVGQRLASFLQRYSIKELMRMFGVAEQTAKSWKAGNLPQMRHLIAMVDRWGAGFLEFIFAPVLAESDLSLARRLERMESDLAAIKEQARHVETDDRTLSGPAARDGGRMAPEAGQKVAGQGKRVGRAFGSALAVLAVVAGVLQPDDDAMARPKAPRARPPVVRVIGGGKA